MGDPLKGAKVTIAGRERTILFTHHALRVAQKRLGVPMSEVIPQEKLKAAVDGGGFLDLGMDVVVELLAAGLLHEDKNISDLDAERLLDADPEAYFPTMVTIIQAWTESQRRLVPQVIMKNIEARQRASGASGESTPPSAKGDDASAAGPTSDSSSTSAGDTTSTPS